MRSDVALPLGMLAFLVAVVVFAVIFAPNDLDQEEK